MNRYISKSYKTSKNTIDRQYTERGQLQCHYYQQVITEFGYNLQCIPQKKFESVVVFLALCYGQSSERSQEVKVMVLLLRGYHETVLIRLTNLMPRLIYVIPPSLPTQCSVSCSVLRVLKKVFPQVCILAEHNFKLDQRAHI